MPVPLIQPGQPLPPGQQLVAAGKWPTVGEKLPRADDRPWRVTVTGEVDTPLDLSLDELISLPQVEQTIDIHCVTRWSKLGVRFAGVSLATIVEHCGARPAARYVSFVARSERSHSTSLPLAEAIGLGALLALTVDGQPLPIERGGPVRVVTPGRYFYKSLKWLESIEFLPHDRLGHWEHSAGYHNTADPWLEQRYVAPDLSRAEAARILVARDVTGRELRSIDAAGRDLTGLVARGAILRDADFRGCALAGACFDGANLTNAHFAGADLRQATFRDADLEGADLAAADLRGADLRGARLFGASFCQIDTAGQSITGARVDDQTRCEPGALEDLTPAQQLYLAEALRQASKG